MPGPGNHILRRAFFHKENHEPMLLPLVEAKLSRMKLRASTSSVPTYMLPPIPAPRARLSVTRDFANDKVEWVSL